MIRINIKDKRNLYAYYVSWSQPVMSLPIDVFDSSPPSAAYLRQWIRSGLVQIMACRLFGAKSLSKPAVGYCQLDPEE